MAGRNFWALRKIAIAIGRRLRLTDTETGVRRERTSETRNLTTYTAIMKIIKITLASGAALLMHYFGL